MTTDEDDEIRRLSYLADNGQLSPRSSSRLQELRSRDRRGDIRDPREFKKKNETEAKGWLGRRRNR